MNLDWDFYFDSWLIDKIPERYEIKIEEHPKGISVNPSELTCYFGSNPIYMQGLGKLYHEVLMSPTGIVIYPEFLERPGFEFVEEISFKVDFDKAKDYWGEDVVDKHVGYINALEYMKNLMSTIYGVGDGEYVGTRTPSSKLRKLTMADRDLLDKSFDNYQVFSDVQQMRDNGCVFYIHGDVRHDASGPFELISGQEITAIAPGAFIVTPGTFGDVLFTKYTYIDVPQQYMSALTGDKFTILFGTAPDFRQGLVFDFGSTNRSTPPNYGFSFRLDSSAATIVLNDGNFNSIVFPYSFDFRFMHRFSLIRTEGYLTLIMDGKVIGTEEIDTIGSLLFDSTRKNYISAISSTGGTNVFTGDFEEIAIFNGTVDDDIISKYYDDIVPIVKPGGINSIVYENIPLSLSYDLTYTKPTNIFIPNFFGAKFDKFYLVDRNGIINIIDKEQTTSSYLTGYEPIENKSILIKNGFTFHSVTTNNYESDINFGIGERIPVLTKLTSDVHIPIRIYMKFKIPEFYNSKITYNIRLVMKSLTKFIWYSYKKYKTGEFV